jgi:hypothetical protein
MPHSAQLTLQLLIRVFATSNSEGPKIAKLTRVFGSSLMWKEKPKDGHFIDLLELNLERRRTDMLVQVLVDNADFLFEVLPLSCR